MSAEPYNFEVIARGLNVVFCGINPAPNVVAAGHSYAHASNRFWRVLHLAGFTDVQLRPEEQAKLLDYKLGSTAVVARATRTAAEVSPAEFRAARPALEAKLGAYSPRAIAFLGKRAYAAMLGKPDVDWGRQADPFAGCLAWVLPNPSGLNRISLDDLVKAYRQLRDALATHIPDERQR